MQLVKLKTNFHKNKRRFPAQRLANESSPQTTKQLRPKNKERDNSQHYNPLVRASLEEEGAGQSLAVTSRTISVSLTRERDEGSPARKAAAATEEEEAAGGAGGGRRFAKEARKGYGEREIGSSARRARARSGKAIRTWAIAGYYGDVRDVSSIILIAKITVASTPRPAPCRDEISPDLPPSPASSDEHAHRAGP